MTPDPHQKNREKRPGRPGGDRVVWVAGVMIAVGVVLCFAALLNL